MKTKVVLGWLVIIVCFSILGWQVWSQHEAIFQLRWHAGFGEILLLVLLTLLVFPVNVLSWHYLTLTLGMKIPLRHNFRIWMTSNFSRYLPGSVWQYFSRAYLTNQTQPVKTKTATSVVLEIILGLWIGTGLTFLGLGYQWILYISLILGIIVMGIWIKLKLPKKNLLGLIGLFGLQFLIAGAMIFLLTKGLSPLAHLGYWQAMSIFCAGWLAGYVIPIAPAGLGVQELALTNLLVQWLPVAEAAAVALALRLSFWLGEICTLIFVLIYTKNDSQNA